MKKRSGRQKTRTSEGFVKFSTLLHERHIAAIERMVSSREGVRRGLTKRDVLYQMIAQYLREDREDSLDVIVGQMRLELERELRAVKQRQHALIEMVALFVRIVLGHAPMIAEEQKEAFRARSFQRFEKYSDEVVRMLKQRTDFFETISGEALFEAFRNQFSAAEEERGGEIGNSHSSD